jgi:hypothetical protein
MSCAWAWAWRSSVAGLLAAAALACAPPARAGVYASQQEALAQAFPDSDRIERRSFVLTDAQHAAVERLAQAPLESRIQVLHTGMRGGQALGFAWIDVHTVRTLPEALMVVVTPEGAVRSVRTLAFHEPEEYLPPDAWRRLFEGRELGPDLQIGRGIHAVAGATLSARATTRAVRTALALHRVLVLGDAGQKE